ncbi:MAG: hypothetical protein HUJ16_10485 [Kangiella sp.]|nr:hypothetical protein [Kangiella sp.]
MKSILNSKWKIIVAAIPFALICFYMFLRYVPWLFASEPIEMIEFHDVSNDKVPEGALSFAINHGKAMYYFEPVPSEALSLACTVVAIFSIAFLVLLYLGRNLKKLDNVT